jgi:hypothetical protein
MARETNILVPAPDPEQVIHRDHLIRVTNTYDETIKGRWNGRDFVFKKDVPVDMPIAAAEHIWGFGIDDPAMRVRSFNNTGILHKRGTYDACVEWMKGIRFAEPPPLVEMSEGDPRRKITRGRLKKVAAANPSVNGDGEAGGLGDTGSPDDPDEGAAEVL